MGVWSRLVRSWRVAWESPALLSVSLLAFMLTVLLGVLFLAIDLSVVFWLNPGAGSLETLPQWLDMRTAVVVGILAVVQLLVFVYVDTFFKAGQYGMMKNALQDGTTTFSEFLPSAKRYWHATFWYTLVRYALTLVALLPVVIMLVLALRGVDVGVWRFAFVAVSALLWLVVATTLLYAEPIIVHDDTTATDAMRTSVQLSMTHIKTTLATMLLSLAILGLGLGISATLHLPFDALARTVQSPTWDAASAVVQFLLNVVVLVATIIAMLLVFWTHHDVRGRHRYPTKK